MPQLFKFVVRTYERQKHLVWMLLAALSAILIAYPTVNAATIGLQQHVLTQRVRALENGLDSDKAYSLQQAREIVDSKVLNGYIAANDHANALVILDAEEKRRSLSQLIAVNKDGVAVAGVPSIGNYGDYVAQTQAWGRIAATGESTSAIGQGRTFPLVLIGATPIIEANQVIGAIYAGFRFDDAYTKRFREKYVGNDAQLIFYEATEGVIGTSFTDATTATAIKSYFSAGSDWIQNAKSGTWLSLGGHDYLLENIAFPDPNSSDRMAGGALILVPLHLTRMSMLVALLVAGIAFILMRYMVKENSPRPTVRAKTAVALWCLLILGIAFTINLLYLKNHVTAVKKSPYLIYNSTLQLLPDSNILDIASPQRISIRLNSGGESINAIKVALRFDPEAIRVDDVLVTNSICRPEFFLERAINSTNGTVDITCIIPSPGFTNQTGIIADLLVQPLRVGSTTISFGPETQILANDGLGTNVLRAVVDGSYFINQPPTFRGTGLPTISVFSPSHGNQARWYRSRQIKLVWPAYPGYQFIYALDHNEAGLPDHPEITNDNTLVIQAPSDGIFYFHVALTKNNIVGPVSTFKVKIDTQPPELPTIHASTTTVVPGDIVRLEFSSRDDTSGLAHGFYVNLDDSTLLPSLPQLYIPFLDKGMHHITVRAFDNAGNYSDATLSITVRR